MKEQALALRLQAGHAWVLHTPGQVEVSAQALSRWGRAGEEAACAMQDHPVLEGLDFYRTTRLNGSHEVGEESDDLCRFSLEEILDGPALLVAASLVLSCYMPTLFVMCSMVCSKDETCGIMISFS